MHRARVLSRASASAVVIKLVCQVTVLFPLRFRQVRQSSNFRNRQLKRNFCVPILLRQVEALSTTRDARSAIPWTAMPFASHVAKLICAETSPICSAFEIAEYNANAADPMSPLTPATRPSSPLARFSHF